MNPNVDDFRYASKQSISDLKKLCAFLPLKYIKWKELKISK
jgi:hypothetical protein